ncbi:MAG: poly-gamma-glutamate hydrolase family protein, partial [Deltaproteobacteria bacterium]|nr:poly-gamma-glutamate hydrolase family protein [Kofleriaceae bacterium]
MLNAKESRGRTSSSTGIVTPIGASTLRRLWFAVALTGCEVAAIESGDEPETGTEHEHDADDVGALGAAGAGDRYSCVTTSQPGCNFDVGIGESLFGAAECTSGVDFHVTSRDQDRSQPLVLAIHGGKIEDGTAQLASLLVAELGWDSYVFRATPTSATCDSASWMHVTSTRFNSATARALARSHPAAVSLHGYSETNPARAGWPQDRWFVCVGGDRAQARAAFIAALNQPAFSIDGRRVRAIDATTAGSATANVCGGLGGTGTTNIANLPPGGGLQLELPRRLRARVAGLDGLARSSTLRARLVDAVDAA